MPVGLMLATMSSAELTEWMAWFDYKANPPKVKQTPQEIRTALEALASRTKGAR